VHVATMEEEGHSGKISDRSEVLLHCSVANTESFMAPTTIVKALSFAVVPCTSYITAK